MLRDPLHKEEAKGSLMRVQDLISGGAITPQSLREAGAILSELKGRLTGVTDSVNLHSLMELAEDALLRGAYSPAKQYVSLATQDIASRAHDWEAIYPEVLSVDLVRKKLEEARDGGEYKEAFLLNIRKLIEAAPSRIRDIPGHFYYSVDELVHMALSAEDPREAERLIDRSLGLCRLQKAAP